MLRSPRRATLPFQWNGGEIGDITHLVIDVTPIDSKLLLTFVDHTRAHITKHIGTHPLIADELKPIFGLDKIGRCSCYYLGEKAMIHRHHAEEYLLETVDFPISLDEVKRVFVFRWFLGMTLNYQRCIVVKRYRSGISRVTSYNDTIYDYMNLSSWGSQIPGSMVKRWFDADYDSVARKMLEGLTFQQLRTSITAVVNRIDLQHNYWIISILSRIGRYVEVPMSPALEPQTIVSGGKPTIPPIPDSLPSPTAPPRSITTFTDAGPLFPVGRFPIPITPRTQDKLEPLVFKPVPIQIFGLRTTPIHGLTTILDVEDSTIEDVTFVEIDLD